MAGIKFKEHNTSADKHLEGAGQRLRWMILAFGGASLAYAFAYVGVVLGTAFGALPSVYQGKEDIVANVVCCASFMLIFFGPTLSLAIFRREVPGLGTIASFLLFAGLSVKSIIYGPPLVTSLVNMIEGEARFFFTGGVILVALLLELAGGMVKPSK